MKTLCEYLQTGFGGELSQMAVSKSLRLDVSANLIIDSCNLKLEEPVGQGTESLLSIASSSLSLQESMVLYIREDCPKASPSFSVKCGHFVAFLNQILHKAFI